ncbi:tyrosine-type recombinase/integrase [Actinoplanes sp. NPDC051859]|uniref:tyrosine-type recombinase/integrase n=1 Tax=Actinoplanes sp. NPDC051859 TaxID=3363909 RepID=UPI003790BB01
MAAAKLAEARKHRITAEEVYNAILGLTEDLELPEEPETPYLADWIEEWLTLKVDVAESTKAEYARLLRGQWISDELDGRTALAKLRVGEIDRVEDIDPWKATLSAHLMPAGVRKHWAVLSMVMRDTAPKFRSDNPLGLQPGQTSHGLPQIMQYDACFLTEAEAEILLAACPPEIRDIVLVALGTGMRLGELLGLRVGAVSLSGERPVVYVEKSLRRVGGLASPKSARSRRPIDLPKRVVKVLARLTAGRNRNEFVFLSPGGKAWDANNFRSRYWRYAVAAAQRCADHPPKKAKVGNGAALDLVRSTAVSTCACPKRLHQQPRFHDLRHSYVAYLIDAGFDFLQIQYLVGHASIKTTFDTYGHQLPRGDRERLKLLNAKLPGGAKVTELEEFEAKRAKSLRKKAKKARSAPFIVGLQVAA